MFRGGAQSSTNAHNHNSEGFDFYRDNVSAIFASSRERDCTNSSPEFEKGVCGTDTSEAEHHLNGLPRSPLIACTEEEGDQPKVCHNSDENPQ